MILRNATHLKPQASLLLSDPLFRNGYGEVWLGLEPQHDTRWDEADRLTYARGRAFAETLIAQGSPRAVIARGGLLVATTVAALTRAIHDGDVR